LKQLVVEWIKSLRLRPLFLWSRWTPEIA
jgi:hypothetical protein